jgi:hypothetical protein
METPKILSFGGLIVILNIRNHPLKVILQPSRRGLSVSAESEKELQVFVLSYFLNANRPPLRSKML